GTGADAAPRPPDPHNTIPSSRLAHTTAPAGGRWRGSGLSHGGWATNRSTPHARKSNRHADGPSARRSSDSLHSPLRSGVHPEFDRHGCTSRLVPFRPLSTLPAAGF